jgi:hypothetical protein
LVVWAAHPHHLQERVKTMDLQLQIDIDGDVTKTTLAQFLADNADDAHLTHDRIVGALREEGMAIIGGGAAPVVRITAASDVEVYVDRLCDPAPTLYEAMFIAENRMVAALRRAYGDDMLAARYDTRRNSATPELAKARADYVQACDAYFARPKPPKPEPDMDDFNWTGSRHHY